MNPCTSNIGPRAARMIVAVSVAAAALAALPGHSQAQTVSPGGGTMPTTVDEKALSADFKGTIGMGLIGAELGFVLPALVGARDTWAFIVFPVIGAGGGAAAGYFLLEKNDNAELAVASLVAGMALVVPALVVTLAATAYEPDTESAMAAAEAGPGLLRLTDRGTFVAPPGVSAGSLVSPQEALRTGAPRPSSVRVSLVSGRF